MAVRVALPKPWLEGRLSHPASAGYAAVACHDIAPPPLLVMDTVGTCSVVPACNVNSSEPGLTESLGGTGSQSPTMAQSGCAISGTKRGSGSPAVAIRTLEDGAKTILSVVVES